MAAAWQHRPNLRLRADSVCATDTAEILSAINALFFFGGAVGAIAQCFVADWLGRKKALAIAGVLALIGGALVAGSVVLPMLIVVRILQGGGVGMLLALVPLYLTEVSPPQRRGFLTGLSTLSFGLGYVVYVRLSVQPQKFADGKRIGVRGYQ